MNTQRINRELLRALEDAAPLVAAWACHQALQALPPDRWLDATGPEGWHPVHRDIHQRIQKALAHASHATAGRKKDAVAQAR